MSATFATTRDCPYCGSKILLADSPIVATNFPSSEFREDMELEDVALPSGSQPLRLLAKTRWPVVAPSPNEQRADQPEPSRKLAVVEAAFGALRGPTADALPPLLSDGVHMEDVPSRACSVCEFPLPPDIDERPAVVVAIVGVNRVGKTHLLAASLTEAYARRGLAALGCTEFVPSEVCSTRFMVDYNHPLFRRNEVLEATQAESAARFEPLVFNVTFEGISPFSLVVHDVAGEVLGDYRKRAEAATYLRAARGIIFVIDPRDIDLLRDGLPDWILDNNETGFDQGALLASCLKPDAVASETPVPVALVVSKADLLPLASGEQDLSFLVPAQPATETSEEFVARINDFSRSVRSFLERYGAYNILGPAKAYVEHAAAKRAEMTPDKQNTVGNLTFHAVSALGSPPDENDELRTRVRPVNCVDPLGAVLAQIVRKW